MTMLLGCGYGPFNEKRFRGVAEDIIKLSSLNIFRDCLSAQRAKKITENAYSLEDPAIASMLYYQNNYEIKKNNAVAINFRYGVDKRVPEIRNALFQMIKKLSNEYESIRLIPMHTFFKGGDDRAFYSTICGDDLPTNAEIMYKPIDLYSLYQEYASAKACIGMRYHAIVMQTVLNGNNYIIDYTEKNQGKVSGFLKETNDSEFYNNRYINIYGGQVRFDECIDVLKNEKRYIYKKNYEDILKGYKALIDDVYEGRKQT